MDRGRSKIWGCTDLAFNGGRDLHHLHTPRRQRVGVLEGGASLIYSRRTTSGVRVLVLHSAASLRSGKEITTSDAQADVFQTRYGNTFLTAFVALVGVISLLPYAQVQLTGLGIIVEVSSFGAVDRTPAMIVAFAIVAAFVFVSGVRGVAWVSAIKDILLLFTAVFVGIAVPYIYFGGIGPMFAAVAHAKPNHLVMPGATTNFGHSWYISTVLLVALSFYMWPQNFAASFTARSGNTLRRNAVFMPLYSLTQPLIFFVGLTALLVLPGLSNGDLAFLTIVRKTFPAWFTGGHWRRGRTDCDGSSGNPTSKCSYIVRQKPVPSHPGARYD